jgi:diketogulonate reductase-like aldo/keto reductase
MTKNEPDSAVEHTLSIDGVRVPRLLYGTAWKEDETQRLTELAIRQGFRGIDTANQRRHYCEAAVGAAVEALRKSGEISREHLFLQTKYTFRRGQDERLPYDPAATIREQVRQSLESSLQHLHTDVIDSYVLHGPTTRSGLVDADWEAWGAMEEQQQRGRVRLLGVSNVTLEQLKELCQRARIRPRFVQNRCYASHAWDRDLREFCRSNGVTYQGFSLLTANQKALAHPLVCQIAKRLKRTPSQVVLRFALEVGMVALTGTTSGAHMRDDLEIFDFALPPADIVGIERVAAVQ